jgi:hypothetical protein
MAEELDASIAGIAQLNGILVMMLGITSFVGIVFGRIFGKRPFLVLTLLLEIAGLVWGANGECSDINPLVRFKRRDSRDERRAEVDH